MKCQLSLSILAMVALPVLALAQDIWPVPRDVFVTGKESFTISSNTMWVAMSASAKGDIETSGLLALMKSKYSLEPTVAGPEKLAEALKSKEAVIIGLMQTPELSREVKQLFVPPSEGYPGNEGYVIDVSAKRILVLGRDERGVFYGLQSLKQLLTGEMQKPVVNAMEIVDWPEYEMRAVYLAITAGVPADAMEIGRKVVELAASLKYDQVCVELDNGGYARLDMPSAQEGKKIADVLKDFLSYCKKYRLDSRPEGRWCFYPRGPYPQQDPFACDPLMLEGIQTTEVYTLKGVEPFDFTIQRWNSKGEKTGEPIPVREVMHDIKTGKMWDKEPVIVKNTDETVTYEEGKDYELKFGKIVAHWSEKVNYGSGHPKGYGYSVLRWATYAPDREPTTITRTATSRIPDGAQVKVAFTFIGPDPYSRWKYRECLSDPRVYVKERSNPLYRLCRDVFDMVGDTPVYGIEYDEYRTLAWDNRCLTSGLTRQEICAKYIKAWVDFVLEKRPGTKIVMWSDMIDPFHNATDYKVDGTAEILAKEGYNKKIIAQPWHSGVGDKSVDYFAKLGFSFMPSCQGPPPDAASWKWRYYIDRACKDTKLSKSLQYTHWEGTEGWGKIVSGQDEKKMESVKMVAQAGWSLAPHIVLSAPVADDKAVAFTVRVTGDPYYYTPEGAAGEAVVGENAGEGGKGQTVKGPCKIAGVTLYYRNRGAQTFAAVPMEASADGSYAAKVEMKKPNIEFYVEARDANNTTRSPVTGTISFRGK